MAQSYGDLIDVLAAAELSFRVQATSCGTATRVMPMFSLRQPMHHLKSSCCDCEYSLWSQKRFEAY